MNTKILECAKLDGIEGKSPNTWTNIIRGGAVVKKGAQISVEGISINSLGIGGNIIEVPDRISNGNIGTLGDVDVDGQPRNAYSSSAQSLVCGFYMVNNFKDTIMMPISNFDQTPALGVSACMIVETKSLNGVDPNPLYGYLDRTIVPQSNFQDMSSYPTIVDDSKIGWNSKFYVIAPYILNDGNGSVPDMSTCTNPSSYNPIGFEGWKILTTELRFDVDKGYDSPQNIGITINNQIQSAGIRCDQFDGVLAYTENNDGGGLSQLQATKGSVATIPVNSKFIGATGNYWYQNPMFLYPNFVCAGYNLISPLSQKTTLEGRFAGSAGLSSQGELLNMNDLPNNGVHLQFPEGTVMVSNLLFTPANLDRVNKYLWSQGGFAGGIKIDPNMGISPANNNINYEYFKKHPEIFYRYIDLGRLNDNVIGYALPPGIPLQTLSPLTYDDGANVGFQAGRSDVQSQLKMHVGYTKERYNNALTPADMINGQPGMTLTYQKVNTYVDIYGDTIDVQKMCELYNINVVAIKCNSAGNQHPRPVIGFVLDEVDPLVIGIAPVEYSNYVLYDPAFQRLSNCSIKAIGWKLLINSAVPLSPTSVANFESSLQIGCPNPSFEFNDSASKFQFSNLHWGNYIGSGDSRTGVASSPEQVISMNKASQRFGTANNQMDIAPAGRSLPSGLADYKSIFMTFIYADSGLGFLYYGMKIEGTNRWDYLDAVQNHNITINPGGDFVNYKIDPVEYFNGSLLNRIGWEYEDLFPTYGKCRSLFNTDTYNKVPELWRFNPLPSALTLENYLADFNYGVRPFTTNPFLSSNLSVSLSINNFGQPMFDAHLQRAGGFGIAPVPLPIPNPDNLVLINIDEINVTTQSAFLTAKNLSKKLEFPYWLIYSDIIENMNFYGKDGQPANVVAIANRAYTSGDFAFNFATSYTFEATQDFVLSHITTAVLNPDYSEANVDTGTIILYKIQQMDDQPDIPDSKVKRV